VQTILNGCGLNEYKICDVAAGNDDQIHILLAETVPEREQGMFVPSVSNTHYQAVSLTVDWQDGSFVGYEKTDFGVLMPNFHFIQKLHDGFLLLGARSRYNNGSPDQNAWITDRYGTITGRYCFGDGICQCLVDSQNRIITSYFDEGVFGNHGWNSPIGSGGLILWSTEGECLWKNREYDICDCYAINLDRQDRLWFYYYTEFMLVCTDYQRDIKYRPGISGSGAFLVHPKGQQIIFDAGYSKHGTYVSKQIQGSSIRKGEDAVFVYNGVTVSGRAFFREAKALFLDEKMNLYYGEW